MPRSIVHLDADAFFVSVEQAADSRLRGRPVAVGGEKRGIIASASYEARKFGVYTPMPTARARKLCPQLIVLPGDFEKYERFSRWMFAYAYDFTPDVEVASIDEGYFDLSGARRPPAEIAATLQRAIGQALKISVSEGIGSSKLISQIASKLRKPAAFLEVPAGREIPFLHPLPNKWLPGVGPKTARRLNAAGLARIEHVAATPLELLQLVLGGQAGQMREFAHGIDRRPVEPAREAQKSYSEQETFAADVTDEEYLEAVLRRMADSLCAALREDGQCARTLTVRVRYNDMAEDQRSESLAEPTDLETDLYSRLLPMLRQAWKRRVSVRLVSFRLSNLYANPLREELALSLGGERAGALRRLTEAMDGLRATHGRAAIMRGHDLRLRQGPREELRRNHAVSQPRLSGRTKARPYVPLNVRSVYSFLDSTLTPEAIVKLAASQDMPAVGLADTGNLHGAVAFAQAARVAGIKPLIGAETFIDGKPVLLYVENAGGYQNLCRWLSLPVTGVEQNASVAGQERGSRRLEAVAPLTSGLLAISPERSLAELFPGRFYLASAPGREDAGPLARIACPRIHYATPADRQRHEIVQSIRTLTLLREPHPAKRLGGRLHFRTGGEMARTFAEAPALLAAGHELASRCHFSMPWGPPQFPAFVPPDGRTPREFLRKLVMEGVRRRYPRAVAEREAQLNEELGMIAAVGYEEYFLLVWDLLQTCQERGIGWITRGSAADSLVCYCLGISDVCPIRFRLFFRRFLNEERMAMNKLPDIDLDFAHDRKDDVVAILFEKYGAEHCAVVGGFSTFQSRSAFAEAAKVLGVGEREVRRFTERFPWGFGGGWGSDKPVKSGISLLDQLKASPECRDLPLEEEPYRTALLTAEFLDGLPRHPKMHPCGVVLSRQPMHSLTPTFTAQKGYAATHYDMDAVEQLGLVKLDVLAQGGLATMRDAKTVLESRGVPVNLERLEPWDDPQVWALIAEGASRGVHHIESPAMVSLCRMANVREIDGLVAIVSVIRPGAANENKKRAFTRRYQGMEPVAYPHPSLKECLNDSYGLVIYEEHILQLCENFAGLDPGRADVLRRALNKQKRPVIDEIRREFYASAKQRGHSEDKITEVWELASGFAGYAFCKAHSTAYGVEAYQAAWLKRYHPAEFMAAVLSHGKGFYAPLVYVLECRRLGLTFLPPSINEPGPGFTVHGTVLRVPLTKMKGLTGSTSARLLAERHTAPFSSLRDFFERVRPTLEELEAMSQAGAFDAFGQTRTAQFWEIQALHRTWADTAEGQGWLLPPPRVTQPACVPLEEPTKGERLQQETELFGFAISGHPLEMFPNVAWDTYCPVSRLGEFTGQRVVTCGLIVEQRTHHQITGEPMKFLTLADWTGMVETELFAGTYKSHGLATVRYPVLEVEASVEPYENGRGFSLRVFRAGEPREK